MALEFGILIASNKKLLIKETKINLISGLIAIATQYLLKTFMLKDIYPILYKNRILDITNGTLSFVYCFFLFTFIHYIAHYLNHKIRIFWCLHEVHHSATEINSSAGIRSSIFDVISTDALYLLIPIIGIPPVVFFIVYAFAKIWGNFIHISKQIIFRIPLLNYVLVDPAAHHVHHAKNLIYLDKNFGEFVPWYDQLLRTYIRPTETPIYGTISRKNTSSFWDIQLGEFRKLVNDIKSTSCIAHKIGYIFMPPGWKPGDNSHTVKFLQKTINTNSYNSQ
jgi:sterol desaturase/sphingolipid hydroxylase (fatty acid hydroxylase superfamily)